MNDNLEKYIEIIELLRTEKFQLSDIELTSKTAFDWTRSGIYLRERKSKYRRKYSGIEYVWLRLVKELRQFGLPLESIKRLKDLFLTSLNLFELIVMDGLDKKESKLLASHFENAEEELLNTALAQFIFSSLIIRNKGYILITKDGDCRLTYERVTEMLFDEPCINIPIDYLISDFIAREDLFYMESLKDRLDLSDQEQKVLDLLRDGDISSLTVKLKDNEINLIETEEEIDLKNTKGKLVDYIQKGGYQEISYKTQNGKISTIKRVTKHK